MGIRHLCERALPCRHKVPAVAIHVNRVHVIQTGLVDLMPVVFGLANGDRFTVQALGVVFMVLGPVVLFQDFIDKGAWHFTAIVLAAFLAYALMIHRSLSCCEWLAWIGAEGANPLASTYDYR